MTSIRKRVDEVEIGDVISTIRAPLGQKIEAIATGSNGDLYVQFGDGNQRVLGAPDYFIDVIVDNVDDQSKLLKSQRIAKLREELQTLRDASVILKARGEPIASIDYNVAVITGQIMELEQRS